MQEQYQPQIIEEKAQQFWQDNNTFKVTENFNKEKFYCLTMFPYPSGRLHMGHVRVYTIGDVISRYQKMLGKNVLQPMGWDAFGLPAENAAIKHGIAPAKWTHSNIDHMRQQMQSMGFGYDWSREIKTCDPEYYRWEQWFFLQLYKKDLVYKKNAEVNWDPVDQTVLANEQVVDGRGWRSGALVERREIPQWFLKITAYADQLLNDLDKLDGWPQQVKTMQRNWIGRSEGINITFDIEGHDPVSIYTTRPDTLFGVTYLALAPQHPLCKTLAKNHPAIQQFINECRKTKVSEAELATMEKRGIPLNINAIHPITHEKIPVWAANFVVMEYGAGALMAVPAHDQRDFEFAKKFNLPIKYVVCTQQIFPTVRSEEREARLEEQCNSIVVRDAHFVGSSPRTDVPYLEPGILIDSGAFTSLTSDAAFNAIADFLEAEKTGGRQTNYRLRDWGVSRQRYWGTPIPIINCPHCGSVPVPEADLPVILPENVQFEGVTSPLKSMPDFINVACPQCNHPAERETDTFDTFVESSWYYARYACKKQPASMLDGRANYWVPVDQYVGGIEHAVLHLLYARFFHKLMRDEGLLNSDEPFTRLLTQGMVLNQGAKMSKSKGNVVDPQRLIEKFGADTVRLFMMFASPPDQNLEWSDSGVEGAHRFIKRLWSFGYENKDIIRKQNLMTDSSLITNSTFEQAGNNQLDIFRQVYDILSQVKFDYERQQYNTVVSGCMKILNLISKLPAVDENKIDINNIIIHKSYSILLRLLAPITPHITHQLWQDLKYGDLILEAEWPKQSGVTFKIDTVELVVQVNGKLRSHVRVPINADKSVIETNVINDAKIQQAIQGKDVKKIITVPGRLVNIVTGDA